jgi:hypothetical protein
MLRIIRGNQIIGTVDFFTHGDQYTLPDGTIIQSFQNGQMTEDMLVPELDYHVDTPKACQYCGRKLLLAPIHHPHRDIRRFHMKDGSSIWLATCMAKSCLEQFTKRCRQLSYDPNVKHGHG